jgi:hypothetical protein
MDGMNPLGVEQNALGEGGQRGFTGINMGADADHRHRRFDPVKTQKGVEHKGIFWGCQPKTTVLWILYPLKIQ